ncbi:Prolyl endopeptidase [Triticum urartu]|uniref:Prolyl endopeptidase n=1 Tax=Triticum urartu TaxID=4572 RepID=M7YR81_TRIUA|nr:Prolyl endopeptidase [Triticum urartu]
MRRFYPGSDPLIEVNPTPPCILRLGCTKYRYSPLHNVKRPWEQSFGDNCQYPATMLLTADHDDRVVPLHSLKLLAFNDNCFSVQNANEDNLLWFLFVIYSANQFYNHTMQHVLCTSIENSPQTNPIVGRIDRKSGHGAGRPTKKLIDEAADRYSFMSKMLGATWTE